MGPRKRKRYNAALFTPPTKVTVSEQAPAKTVSSQWLLRGYAGVFDKIPNEILEKIFIYSENTNFARASHIIGARLSNRYIYRAIFRAVFCYLSGPAIGDKKRNETVISDYTHVFAVVPDAPALESQELVTARNEVLKSRWLNHQIWSELIEEIVAAEKTRLKTCFSSDSDYHHHCDKGFKLELGKRSFIPGKLLRWPLTSDGIQFLSELHDHGARIDWINTLDGETAKESRRKAVEEEDVEAFLALVCVTSDSPSDVAYVCDLFLYGRQAFFNMFIRRLRDERGYNIDWTSRNLWQAANTRLNGKTLSNSNWPLEVLRDRAHDDLERKIRRA